MERAGRMAVPKGPVEEGRGTMRLWSLARWVVVLAVLGWAGYVLTGAGWTYYATQELVDQVLREASNRYRSSITSGVDGDVVAAYVRNSIVLNARRDGLMVDEKDVSARSNAAGISASVRWSYAILSHGGADILVVPMSVQRSINPVP
jgi:hypothetical protein